MSEKNDQDDSVFTFELLLKQEEFNNETTASTRCH